MAIARSMLLHNSLLMKRKRLSQIKLSHLQVLLTVAACRSFSEAALQLEMSQSAVSNAIATLEADLGVILFSRGRYGALLTPVGERIIAHAQQMVHLQDEILKEAQLARSLQGGQVRITSFRSVTTHILPGVIAQFHRRFPDVSVTILEHFDDDSIEEDLRKGRADLGFVEHEMAEEFKTWKLLQDEYVVLLPSSFQQVSDLSWEQLGTYPLVMASTGDGCDAQVYAHCLAFGKTLQTTYQVRADSSIISMVAQGLGATIIPRLAAEPIPAGVQVFSLPVPLYRTIYVATLAEALHVPAVFAFLELVLAVGQSAGNQEPLVLSQR